MQSSSLIITCDDAGFASVDRGIRHLVDSTGVPVSAEYLIEQDGAAKRAKDMAAVDLVSCGLHFELSSVSDADRVQLSRSLQAQGTSLGEQADIRTRAEADARRQLKIFQDALGMQPAHISTHGDFQMSAKGEVMEWWLELMDELFDGAVPPMQLLIPHIRHNLYSWNTDAARRDPCTPAEFHDKLLKMRTYPTVEFVLHPALPQHGDASLDMLFTADMRIADMQAAIDIINSGVIEEAGFTIIPVSALQR